MWTRVGQEILAMIWNDLVESCLTFPEDPNGQPILGEIHLKSLTTSPPTETRSSCRNWTASCLHATDAANFINYCTYYLCGGD